MKKKIVQRISVINYTILESIDCLFFNNGRDNNDKFVGFFNVELFRLQNRSKSYKQTQLDYIRMKYTISTRFVEYQIKFKEEETFKKFLKEVGLRK